MNVMSEAMSEAPSYYYENKEYLLDLIMRKLEISETELREKSKDWVKSKVRESNLEGLV